MDREPTDFDRQQQKLIFISYAQAARDVREWSLRLPREEILAVCGIPRSGSIIGGMLAEQLGVRYVELDTLVHTNHKPWQWPHRRRIPVKSDNGSVLVVDDSAWTGQTLFVAQQRVARYDREGVTYKFASLYYGDGAKGLDYRGRRLHTISHTSEWALLRDGQVEHWAIDMDGVLCEDWNVADGGGDIPEYQRHLNDARPLYVPTWPIHAIVTGRRERFRTQTMAWLQRHGIKYGKLVMMPDDHPRETHEQHAAWKADVFASMSGAWVFCESGLRQAETIARKTGKTVLSIEGMKLFNGDEIGEWAE